MSNYTNILRPIEFDGLKSKNRLYFSSVGFDLCNRNGKPETELYNIYSKIMQNGCGFGFLGNATVSERSSYTGKGHRLYSHEHVDYVKPFFELAAEHDFILGAQLQHYGLSTVDGKKFVPSIDVTKDELQIKTEVYDDDTIHEIINDFLKSAKLAKLAGAKIVQLHAGNGYLIGSFISPRTNQRDDFWGGSNLKRANLLFEIIKEIKLNIDIGIFVRLGIDDGLKEEGLTVYHLGEVVHELEKLGVLGITCTVGTKETWLKFLTDHALTIDTCVNGIQYLKQFTKLPIGFSGSIRSLEQAENIVNNEYVDFIGFGRSIVADYEFVQKEMNGEYNKVNACRWDSYCLQDKDLSGAKRVYCCVNPYNKRPSNLQRKHEELRNAG